MPSTRRRILRSLAGVIPLGVGGCLDFIEEEWGGEIQIRNESSRVLTVAVTIWAVGTQDRYRFEVEEELDVAEEIVFENELTDGGDEPEVYNTEVTVNGAYSRETQFEIVGRDDDLRITVKGSKEIRITSKVDVPPS